MPGLFLAPGFPVLQSRFEAGHAIADVLQISIDVLDCLIRAMRMVFEKGDRDSQLL